MLAKKYRLTTNEFNAAFKNGVVLRSAHLLARVAHDARGVKVAVVAGKKVAKTAVARNAMRRSIFACVERLLKEKKLRDGSYIFVVTRAPLPSHTHLCAEIAAMLFKNDK